MTVPIVSTFNAVNALLRLEDLRTPQATTTVQTFSNYYEMINKII